VTAARYVLGTPHLIEVLRELGYVEGQNLVVEGGPSPSGEGRARP
jgi:hypothetical protein